MLQERNACLSTADKELRRKWFGPKQALLARHKLLSPICMKLPEIDAAPLITPREADGEPPDSEPSPPHLDAAISASKVKADLVGFYWKVFQPLSSLSGQARTLLTDCPWTRARGSAVAPNFRILCCL